MGRGFWAEFWHSVRHAYGGILAVLGIPLTLLVWKVDSDYKIDTYPVAIFGIVVVALILTLSHMAYTSLGKIARPLPRVLYGRVGRSSQSNEECLLEPSPLFSHGTAVSFFYLDREGFEVFLGVGRVLNVQDNQKILVEIVDKVTGYDEIFRKIGQNEKGVLESLKVKPTVPSFNPHLGFGGNNDGT